MGTRRIAMHLHGGDHALAELRHRPVLGKRPGSGRFECGRWAAKHRKTSVAAAQFPALRAQLKRRVASAMEAPRSGLVQRQAQPSGLSESETGFRWSIVLGDIKCGLSRSRHAALCLAISSLIPGTSSVGTSINV